MQADNRLRERLSPEQMQLVQSEAASKRFIAALRGWGLDILSKDEDWLVRHTAKRILRQELKENGQVLSPGDVQLADVDISDMVYELYKQDWINKNTTPESRMDAVREWCSYVVKCQANEIWPEAYKGCAARAEGYYEFCGAFQPGHIGLYHNREYVAELLGHDEQLMVLYDADINDGLELSHQPSLSERLAKATVRSEEQNNSVSNRPKNGLELV